MVVYTEFPPIAKCFLITCLCIAVAYYPLGVAASAAQRDLVARSRRQQGISHDDTLSTDLVNRWYIEHRNVSGMMRKVKKVYEDYGVTKNDVPLEWQGPLMMNQFPNDPLSVSSADEADQHTRSRATFPFWTDTIYPDSKQRNMKELVKKVTKIYNDHNITDDDVPLVWQGPIMIARLPLPNDKELEDGKRLKVYPEEYVDDGKTNYAEFHCEAKLAKGDIMDWWIYKSTNLTTDYVSYDGWALQRYEKTEDYDENSTLKLIYPLTLDANNSFLFCYSQDKNTKARTYSKNISVVFHTKKYDMDMNVTFGFVHPKPTNDIYYFTDTAPLEISCIVFYGWYDFKPFKEEIHSCAIWYNVSGNIKEKLVMVKTDFRRNLMKLDLVKLWKPSDNGTKIYCALEYISEDGSTEQYRQRHTDQYTLIYRPGTHDEVETCPAWAAWGAAASVMALAILIEALAVATAAVASSRAKRSSSN